MKLPGIQYTQGVKPLAVQPSGAEAILAESQVSMETAKAFSDLTMNVAEGIAEEQGNERFADASLTMKNAYAQAMTSPNALDAPSIFEGNVETIRAAAEEEMDSISYKVFKNKFDKESQSMQGRLIVDSTFRANKEQRESLSLKAIELARAGEVGTGLNLVGESILFTDAEKDELYTEMNRQFALGSVEATIYSNDPDKIASEIVNLKSSEYTGPLKGTERSSSIASLEGAFKDATAAMQEAIAHKRGRILGDMSIAIRTGRAGPLQIEEVYDKYPEWVTPSKREEMMELYYKVSSERNDTMNRKILVRQALAFGEPLDPKDTDHKKGVNEIFEDEPTLLNGINLAIKTNIMPERLKADFRRLAIAGDPKRVLELANAFEVIQRENPISIDDFGSNQIAVYTTVASLNRGGVPLAEAVEIARTNAAKPPEERRQYRFNLKSEEYTPSERLQSAMDASDLDVSWWPTGAPDPSPAMQAAYSAAEAEYYTFMDGDVDMANQAAFKHMLRIYSTSDINGDNQVMAYAPDRVTGLPTDFLRKQLIKTAKKAEPKILPKNFFIVSDAQTAREPGVKSYPVYKLNKFELPEPIIDDEGKQLRWTPKVGKYKEHLQIQRGKALAKEKVGMMTPGKEQQFLFGK